MAQIDTILALRRAAVVAGGQVALGVLLHRSQQMVSYWITSGKGLPAEHVLTVEAATGVPRWELRPDIYPPFLAAGPEARAA